MFELTPIREMDWPIACSLIVEAREWSTRSDTFVPPMAVLSHPDSKWYSAFQNNELAGIVGFHGISWIDGTAEMFTALVPDKRGKGLPVSLVKHQLGVGFKELGFIKITMMTLEGSPSAAIADHLKIRKEGVFPLARLKQGNRPTALAYGIFRGEYDALP